MDGRYQINICLVAWGGGASLGASPTEAVSKLLKELKNYFYNQIPRGVKTCPHFVCFWILLIFLFLSLLPLFLPLFICVTGEGLPDLRTQVL